MLLQVLMLCACTALVTSGAVDASQGERESRLVRIDQGLVRGYKDEDLYIFYGIPYATAPTGPNKYRPPLPPPTWTDTLEAVQTYTVICPQNTLNFPRRNFKMQEDCLIANVYVPDTQETNLPVVVYVHGGAYQIGFGTKKTPKNLVRSKKVIAVNFNYRLGPHGFLCLGTKDIPGNAGMKDQVALLRWVQRNIESFGGNPDDVTIAGYSAGASAVDLIMVSKMAKGLFHKVIPESGASAGAISIQIDPLKNAKNVAKEMKFDNIDDIGALENFYKNEPLSSFGFLDVLSSKNSSVIFAPCIERDLGEEMFLDDYPANILENGDYPKVPMLYGIAEMEGLFRIPFFNQWKNDMNEEFSNFFPEDLQFTNENEKMKLERKIKQFYFKGKPVSERNILRYIDYFTDVMFGYGTAKAVQLHVEAGHDQIYLYEYGLPHERDDYIPHKNFRGANHCAQTVAVLDEEDEHKLSQDYQNMKTVMRDLWLNFITTGKPVPDGSSYPAWPPVGANRSPHMYLNSTLQLRRSFLGKRAPFWDNIYRTNFRNPIPPPAD